MLKTKFDERKIHSIYENYLIYEYYFLLLLAEKIE
jgi:hypothetical protein